MKYKIEFEINPMESETIKLLDELNKIIHKLEQL